MAMITERRSSLSKRDINEYGKHHLVLSRLANFQSLMKSRIHNLKEEVEKRCDARRRKILI
jgi:hypothetical protein